MRDDEFEWDDRKAAQNLAKHKFSFADARNVFADPYRVERADDRQSYDEDRYSVLGMVRDKLFYVAFSHREDRIRIITARRADSREHHLYHEAKTQGQ